MALYENSIIKLKFLIVIVHLVGLGFLICSQLYAVDGASSGFKQGGRLLLAR
jgi:hypothetical protein